MWQQAVEWLTWCLSNQWTADGTQPSTLSIEIICREMHKSGQADARCFTACYFEAEDRNPGDAAP
jgi:hypothetical protein